MKQVPLQGCPLSCALPLIPPLDESTELVRMVEDEENLHFDSTSGSERHERCLPRSHRVVAVGVALQRLCSLVLC